MQRMLTAMDSCMLPLITYSLLKYHQLINKGSLLLAKDGEETSS
jgi:hypothetical protein